MHKGVAHEIPLDRIGHFDSDRVYLVQYNYRKQSSLYTWLECALYVWVGQDVGGGELTLKEAIACAESISPSKQVVREGILCSSDGLVLSASNILDCAYHCIDQVASFPGSTAQRFLHFGKPYRAFTKCKKCLAVEPGNEAIDQAHQ